MNTESSAAVSSPGGPAVPRAELAHRAARLQDEMRAAGLDGIVIAQSADLFYFTGTVQSGTLYVPLDGPPLYMVRRDLERAQRESSLEHIVPIVSMRDIAVRLAEHGVARPARLGFELDVLPVSFHERYCRAFPEATSRDAAPLIRRVRMLKSAFEVSLIRRAAEQADRVLSHAQRIVREGMSEIELAAELEHVARLEGHPGLIHMRSFNGEMLFAHVTSGPDSSLPSYLDTPLGGAGPHPSFGQGAGWRRIGRHEPIIVDWGGFAGGYLADQTRVLSIGELPGHLARAYDAMVEVEDLMRHIVAPGVPWSEVYERCLALAIERGYAASFMGAAGAQVSFIGHGLGIEIDEPPFLAKGLSSSVLEPGMVFAFEPKVVYPGEGAVGIEDTFYLGSGGLEQLTISAPTVFVVSG